MWVFEILWVICAKPPFLHSLDDLIKMFANSLAVLNPETPRKTDHIPCFQTQLTESCLVVWFWIDKGFHSLYEAVWIPRLVSGLMVSGMDIKPTLKSTLSIYRCAARYTLACTCIRATI